MAQNRQDTRGSQGRTPDQSGQFRCSECGQSFQTENELKEHEKTCPQPVRNT
jgi:hypothetical protein